MTFGHGSGHPLLVVRAIGGERGQKSWHLVEQGADPGTVVDLLRSQRRRDDLPGVGVQADVQLKSVEWSGTARASPSRPMTEPIRPSV